MKISELQNAPARRFPRSARTSWSIRRRRSGFTLLELLLSMTILSLVLVMVGEIIGKAKQTWQDSRAAVSQFKEARRAFEEITLRLSQATLNTYWDYQIQGGVLKSYERQSELHFVSGPASEAGGTGIGLSIGSDSPTHGVFFQAPLGYTDTPEYVGLNTLLNSWGYFISYASDLDNRPPFITTDISPERWRFRLMEFRAPSENNRVYKNVGGTNLADGPGLRELAGGSSENYYHWFRDDLNQGKYTRVLADNIIGLLIKPTEAAYTTGNVGDISRSTRIAPNYGYDSREWQWKGASSLNDERMQLTKHQVPPLIQVTMIAIDERSADLLDISGDASPGSAPTLIDPGLFAFSANYKNDIRSLEVDLLNKKIDFRVFQSTIIMRASKWSSFFQN